MKVKWEGRFPHSIRVPTCLSEGLHYYLQLRMTSNEPIFLFKQEDKIVLASLGAWAFFSIRRLEVSLAFKKMGWMSDLEPMLQIFAFLLGYMAALWNR